MNSFANNTQRKFYILRRLFYLINLGSFIVVLLLIMERFI